MRFLPSPRKKVIVPGWTAIEAMGKRKAEETIYLLFFLSPCLTYILMWRVGPIFYTLGMSFFSASLVQKGAPRWVGLANYIDILTNPRYINALRVTFLMMIATTSIELLMGLGFALLLHQEIKGKNIFQTCILLPMFVPSVAVATVWYIMLHYNIGPGNYVLTALGLPRVNWLSTKVGAFWSIVVSDIWQWTGFMFLLIFAALHNISIELYESAKVDGANNFQLFWYITLPAIRAIMIIAAFVRSLEAFRLFDKIFVLTFGGPGISTETVTMLIWKTVFRWFRMGQGVAMIGITLVLLGVVYYSFMRMLASVK